MEKPFDLIIIGSGPAGITAAIYAIRKKLDVLLLGKSFEFGGQLIKNTWIENYPGFPGIPGFDLAEKLKQHAVKLNININEGEVTGLNRNDNNFEVKILNNGN